MIIDLLMVIHTSRFVHIVDNPDTSFLNPRQKTKQNNCLNAISPAHNTRLGFLLQTSTKSKAQMSCTWDKAKGQGNDNITGK
jgi:hypothetical protein